MARLATQSADSRLIEGGLMEVVAAALEAGCRWLSVREKDLSKDEQVALAQKLLPLARRRGARLILHGDADLARQAGLDGVHLSAGSDAGAARALLGPHALVGLSVHRIDELAGLDPAAIDYVIAGPAYETASKPGYGPALGPDGLAAFVRATSIPVIAVGGIAAHNAAAILAAGVAGIAVMGGVMRADDAGAELRGLVAALPRR